MAGLATTAGCPGVRLPSGTPMHRPCAPCVEAGRGVHRQDQPRPVRHRARRDPQSLRGGAQRRSTRPGFRAGAAVARRWPWRSAWSTWPWEPTPPGRVVSRRRSTGSSAIKATFGLVSTTGTVPGVRLVRLRQRVWPPTVALAERAMAELTGPRGTHRIGGAYPMDVPLGPPSRPIVARPIAARCSRSLDPPRRPATRPPSCTSKALGCEVVEIDLEPFLEAGLLLYQGAFVAERYAAVGEWIDAHPDEVDPTVGAIISAAATLGAPQLASDIERLAACGASRPRSGVGCGADSLLLPTAADPPHPGRGGGGSDRREHRSWDASRRSSTCSTCAPSSVPFGTLRRAAVRRQLHRPGLHRPGAGRHRLPSRAGGDSAAVPPVGRRSWRRRTAGRPAPPGIALGVVGAHLTGQPLNHQLTDRGGRLLGTDAHRRRPTGSSPWTPSRPSRDCVRVGAGGAADRGRRSGNCLPPGFADFVAHVPSADG